MEFKHTMEETLEARFQDHDEMRDIVTHGMASAFSGFTYTWEINEFFNEFENELENAYYEIFGDQWMKDSGAADKVSMDEIRTHLVWGYVEMWCCDKLEEAYAA